MFKGMDLHFLMTFEHHKIMTVSLVIAEKQILAMGGIYLLPIFKCELDGRKRRMCMKLVVKAMIFKEGQNLVDTWVSCHLLMLFA